MADSIVRLKVEDDSFNAKIKEAAKSFADFGRRVASAGVDALGDFAKGVKTAKAAFEGFNAALKANALVMVASLAVQAGAALGEMIGDWITGADDAADAQKNLNDQLEETKRLVDSITNEGDFNARLAKASGASTSEVLKIKADAAQQAMNTAMTTLFDPNVKVGTEEYDKAKKIYEAAAKRYQKSRQDIIVDEAAKQHRTGEYAPHNTGGSNRTKLTPAQQAAADITKAEKAYADTMTNAQQKLLEQMINSDKYDKNILQGQQKLADAYLKAYNMTGDEKYLDKFRETAQHVNTMQAVVDAAAEALKQEEKAAKELAAAQKKLADAENNLAEARKTGSATAIYKAQQKVDALKGNGPQDTGSMFGNLKQSIQTELKFDQMKVDEATLHTLLQTALTNGLESLTVDYSGLQERIAQGIDIPDSTWKELQDEINEKLKEIGVDPISINLKTGGVDKVIDDVKALKTSINTTANVIGTIGTAFNAIEDPAAKVAGVVAQAIANVALAYSQALGSTQAEKFNIWAFIAAAAAATVSMATTIASIHSATGYATGGMIKGNSYSGDNMMAMGPNGLVGLNAGEIVLNQAQARNVAAGLQNNGMGGMRLQTKVRGTELLVWLDNSLAQSGRGELVTWGT